MIGYNQAHALHAVSFQWTSLLEVSSIFIRQVAHSFEFQPVNIHDICHPCCVYQVCSYPMHRTSSPGNRRAVSYMLYY
jgi:hypothetical protein